MREPVGNQSAGDVPLAESLALQPRFEGRRPVQRGQWQGKRHVLPGPQMESKRSRCTLVRFPGEGTWEGTGGGSLDRSEGYKAKVPKEPLRGGWRLKDVSTDVTARIRARQGGGVHRT